MIDTRHEYIGMLVAAADRKYAGKQAVDPITALYAITQSAGMATGVLGAGAKVVSSYAIPAAALWLFGKYMAIPAFAGYAMGHSLGTSTSPSKNDLEAAENNALAKETMRRTKALESMPTVTPQPRNKDMVTRRSAFDDTQEIY